MGQYGPVSAELMSSVIATMMFAEQFLHDTEENDDLGEHQ